MWRTFKAHWPEYLMEAWALGTFMVSAGLFTLLLEHPASPARQAINSALLRRALGGLAMGLTAVCIIYSPWGQQSGAHMNPAVTLSFLRLGKIQKADALFYMLFQCLGGTVGVVFVSLLFGAAFAAREVNYVVTVPGPAGPALAFAAEVVISLGMMLMILLVTNAPRLERWTGVFAGTLVFLFITVEAPYSGMSINPARSLASAAPSGTWTSFWLYLVAPVLGMQLAIELDRLLRRRAEVHCAKLNHDDRRRCIFCGYDPADTAVTAGAAVNPRASLLPT